MDAGEGRQSGWVEFDALECQVYNREKVRRKSRDRAKAAGGDGSACPGREDETQGTALSVNTAASLSGHTVFSSPSRPLSHGEGGGSQASPWASQAGAKARLRSLEQLFPQHPPPEQVSDDRHDRVSCLFSVIESNLLPRLLRNHRTAARVGPDRPTVEEFEAFFAHLMRDDEPALAASIEHPLARGVAMETVFSDLLVAAHARMASAGAVEASDLVAQTVAIARLHELLRRHSRAFQAERMPRVSDRRVLLMAREGDLHGFGMSLAGEFFRHAGWDVVVSVTEDPAVEAQRVRGARFDVAGVWVGHAGLAAWARDLVAALRASSCHQPLVFLACGPWPAASAQRLRELNADLYADLVQAPVLADHAVRWHRRGLDAGGARGAILSSHSR
jgi:hypothetical protein